MWRMAGAGVKHDPSYHSANWPRIYIDIYIKGSIRKLLKKDLNLKSRARGQEAFWILNRQIP